MVATQKIQAGMIQAGKTVAVVAEDEHLYHCGDRYYVLDGHHRIAVARALGERWVWATLPRSA